MPAYRRNRFSMVPSALYLEILRRVPQYNNLREVYHSLLSDWQNGFALPGIGCARFGRREPFPFGERNFYYKLPAEFKKAAKAYHCARHQMRKFIRRQELNLNKMKGNSQ